jgi:Ca2+-binding RTX toxin-like protein
MTALVDVQSAKGSNLAAFTTSVLKDLQLDYKPLVEFDETFIAITGPNGDKLNLKGDFTYTTGKDRLPVTEFANLTGGTVTSITLIENPGILKYAIISKLSLDVSTVLDTLLTGDAAALFALWGDMKYAGGDADDVMKGSSLADSLWGGDGADTLAGQAGNDEIEGGKGADRLIGGEGIDTLSYKNSTAAVSVNLLLGTAGGGHAAGDTFSGFENVEGSDFADRLSGSNGVNLLLGGKGNDILTGSLGADTLDGGGDTDTADYSESRGAITLNLETGVGAGGHAEGDVLTGIENITGTTGRDFLTGNTLKNLLSGNDGNDTLDGGVASDDLRGGAGKDTLVGGQSVDTLTGGQGADSFVLSNMAAGADLITDFKAGLDELDISAAVFGGDLVAGGNLLGSQFEISTTGLASTRDVRFILNSETGQLFFDINGSGGGELGSRLIATFAVPMNGLSAADFDII